MNEFDQFEDFEVFITEMPPSRPADYCLGCCNGSVYIDFEEHLDGLIRLVRISFDGFGCCNLQDEAIPMHKNDSQVFLQAVKDGIPNPHPFKTLISKTLKANQEQIWQDALEVYNLI